MFHDPLSDYLRDSRPVVSRVLSALVTHPSPPPSPISALVTNVTRFASSHHLDYAAHLVSGLACSPSFGGAPVFPLEVLKDRHFELGFLAAFVPHLCTMLLAPEGQTSQSQSLDIPIPRTHAEAALGPWALYWIAVEEAEMVSYRSIGTFINAFPPPGTNVASDMWHYKVKRPSRSPPVFKARHVARGFNYLHVLIWLRRPPSFTGSFPARTQWQLRRPVYGLRQAHREWHDTLRTILATLDFFPSSADPSLFVRCGSTPFFVSVYILMRFLFPFSKVQLTPLDVDHGLTAPPLDEPSESSGPYPELVGCLMYLMTCTRPDLAYPLSVFARFVAPGRHQNSQWYAAKRVAKYVQGGQTVVRRVVSEANTADIFTKALPPFDHQRLCTPIGLVSTGPQLLA
ncbi:unnamed protein product [Closterium sp. NIES-53]